MGIVDDLKSTSTGEPDEGIYQARIERCKIVTTKNGAEMMVTEFTTEYGHEWSAWHGFTSRQKDFAKDFVLGLGIDLDAMESDEELADALADCEGKTFEVRVSINESSDGSRKYVNTYIEATPEAVDRAFGPDVPIDTEGLPDVPFTGDGPDGVDNAGW
jgi:hypothetical protein